jgi:prepilin-type N-terminal cleavage/methylation domain-containing protein
MHNLPATTSQQSRGLAGFTLIEMVIFIALVGILSVYAAPRLLGNSSVTLDSQVKSFAADLRRVQLWAINSGMSLCVLTTATSYSVVYQCNQPANKVPDPANGLAFDRSFDKGLTFTNAAIVPALQFDSLGQANHATHFVISAADGSASLAVNVAALTGYVSVAMVAP